MDPPDDRVIAGRGGKGLDGHIPSSGHRVTEDDTPFLVEDAHTGHGKGEGNIG